MILNILVLLASRRLYCFSQVHKKTQEVMGQPKGGAYLQARVQFAQVQLRASMRVKGMVAAKRRSARTRCRMKMFLAVLITARRRTATITSRFPKTGGAKGLANLMRLVKLTKNQSANGTSWCPRWPKIGTYHK